MPSRSQQRLASRLRPEGERGGVGPKVMGEDGAQDAVRRHIAAEEGQRRAACSLQVLLVAPALAMAVVIGDEFFFDECKVSQIGDAGPSSFLAHAGSLAWPWRLRVLGSRDIT